jgi:polygalacturonase
MLSRLTPNKQRRTQMAKSTKGKQEQEKATGEGTEKQDRRRQFFRGAGVAAAVGLISPLAKAQSYPKNDPVYDVKTYGAVGNGTTDDTAAVVAANAAAAAAGGGIVYFSFSSGAYLISSLTIPANVNWLLDGDITLTGSFNNGGWITQILVSRGCCITGRGYPTIMAGNNTNAQASLYLAGSNRINGLILNGNGANNTSPINAFVATIGINGTECDIFNNQFANSPEFAIYGGATAANYCRVRNNVALNQLGEFIHCGNYSNGAPGSGGSYWSVTNNHLEMASNSIQSFTISFSQVSDSVIAGNTIIITGTNVTNAMALRDPQNITVTGNYAKGSGQEGILLFVQDSGGVCRSNVVTGNVVANAGAIAFGLIAGPGFNSSAITGNSISNNTIIDACYNGPPPTDYDCGIRVTGTGAVGNNVSHNTFVSTLTGQSPARRGFNGGVSFDDMSATISTNIAIGNVFTAADTTGHTTFDFRNLSTTGVAIATNKGVFVDG